MENDAVFDVIIIGGGPAGLTAGIYCSRKKLKNAIISVDIGGQTNLTNHIENYPGTGALSGMELMERFAAEAKKFGTQLMTGQVNSLRKEGNLFKLETSDKQSFISKSVILAFGAIPKMLGIPGEDKFLGRGVSTCTTCDAPLFKGKVTAVVGGGNSAVEGTLELSTIASKVYLIHRRGEFRADPITVDKLKAKKNVELLLNSAVQEVVGEKNVESIKVKHLPKGDVTEVKINGLFVEIGHEVRTDFLKGLVDVNEKNEVIIDLSNKTNVPGIFAAGDITLIPFKQTVISAGEGAKAALECYRYLTGGKIDSIDWT